MANDDSKENDTKTSSTIQKGDWAPFCKKLANNLLEYKPREKRKELADAVERVLVKIKDKINPKKLLTLRAGKGPGKLDGDVDPFTVIGLFGRYKEEKRTAVLDALVAEEKTFKITKKDIPTNFDDMPRPDGRAASFCISSKVDHEGINKLWELFESALKCAKNPEDNSKFIDDFNYVVKNVDRVTANVITRGLNWIAPESFVNLSGSGPKHIRGLKDVPPDVLEALEKFDNKNFSGEDYFKVINWLKNDKHEDFRRLSLDAYNASKTKKTPKPSPTPVPGPDVPKNYWLLKVDLPPDGVEYFALSDTKKDKNFFEAKAGDIVYLSIPSEKSGKIVASCEIVAGQDGKRILIIKQDGKAILIKKIKDFADDPIAYAELRAFPLSKKIKSGVLCNLPREAGDHIKGLADKKNQPPPPNPRQKEELIEEFLSEVYLGKTKKEGTEKYAMLESLLETKKNIILQGPPGVGKTFAATRLAYSLLGLGLQELKEHGNKDPRIQFVQFHQSYSYEDFVMGYKPTGDGFKLQEGIFYKFCKEAQKKEEAYKENPKDTGNWYFLIIDEINRGNTSRIFGELLMLIENGYRGKKHAITLAYEDKAEQDNTEKEDKRFYVPENLFIIGMMNTADRSLAMLDYALRRRFAFVDMRPAFDSDRFVEYQKGLSNSDFGKLIDAVKALNEKIADDKSLGEGFCIGHSYFCNWKECTERKMCNAVWYDILPLLREYYFDNQTKYAERLEPLSSTGLLPEEDKEKFEAWDAKQKPKNGQVATPAATTPPATPAATTPPATPAAPTNQVTSA